jgi:hypothetical protein
MTSGTFAAGFRGSRSAPEVQQMLKRIVVLAGAIVGAVAAYQLGFKPWQRRWQADPDKSAAVLPGDDLVPEPQFQQTMAVTIAATPGQIWPWLLQMGYGRAGWYSYDAIDMLGNSSREIRPDLQDVHVGQIVPFAPGGMAFRVEVVEPERALVLYGDSELIAQQQHATAEHEGAGLKMVGLLSDANMSAFRMSWAFVLEPAGEGRTRLLERFRTTTTPGPGQQVVAPIIDVGHFLMTRKQMLGIRERAEAMTLTAPVSRAAELVPAV